MQESSNTLNDVLIIPRGKEVLAELSRYAKETKAPSAWISGLGGADKVVLSFYNLDSQSFSWTEYEEPLEILNLTGNLAWVDGDPVWHIHGTFSRNNLSVVGGHVKELHIGLTGEFHLTPLTKQLTRQHDETTGLNLIKQLPDTPHYIA